MKKLLAFIFALSSLAMTHAQEHLTFKGVPIDGTLDAFVANMEKAGFKHLGSEDGVAQLQGDFAGYRNCDVSVATLKSLNIVNCISVSFGIYEKWSDLYENYSSLKSMLVKKYGEWSECVERFDTSYPPKDDGTRMTCLVLDRCKYCVLWVTDMGTIKLKMSGTNSLHTGGFVVLSYSDKNNTESIQNKALEDL